MMTLEQTMMTLEQARNQVTKHLGNSKRANHSVFVGYAMRSLAERLAGEVDLWEIVGLCHDLDYLETTGDKSRHGIIAADWLKDDLPPRALDAIRAHDHRTGVRANSELADALKLADALAVADVRLGRATMAGLTDTDGEERLRTLLADQPYLSEMIIRISLRFRLPLSSLAQICEAAPQQ